MCEHDGQATGILRGAPGGHEAIVVCEGCGAQVSHLGFSEYTPRPKGLPHGDDRRNEVSSGA